MRTKMKINVKLWTLVLPCVLLMTPGFADEKKAAMTQKTEEDAKTKSKEELFSAQNISKLSETYGHLIQKGLDNPVLKLDFDAVIKGMQDGKAGKPSPMTEQEYEESINQLQEFAYQDLANRNLQEAEKFLKDNAKKEGVKEIEPSKLQYLILKEGNGDVVTEEMRPMIKYSGQYLDGTVFGSSETGSGPIAISLKQTIPGFKKGILGMKVGEKRRIFIHPELGYGTSGQLLPNALLIFEIEVIDVKPEPKETSKDDDEDSEGMQLSAENLFPDELDERDDFDDDDNDDEDDDADEESDEDDDLADLADFNPDVTRNISDTPDSDLEQNDMKHLNPNDSDELKRAERAKEKARLQRAREEKIKQQQQQQQQKQQPQQKPQAEQGAQAKQQAQPQSVARAEQLEKKDDLDTKKPVQAKQSQDKQVQNKQTQDKVAKSTQKTQNSAAKTTTK